MKTQDDKVCFSSFVIMVILAVIAIMFFFFCIATVSSAAPPLDPVVVDPSLVASIGIKAASDAEIAARYAFYSLIVQSVATVIGSIIATASTVYLRHWAHNTNAIKDELVAATMRKGLAEGNLQGRTEQTAEGEQRNISKGG